MLVDAEIQSQFSQILAPQPEVEGDETEEEVIDGELEEAPEGEALEEEIEASDEDEDEPEADEGAPPTYTVRVDGEELEVPLPELIAGYSRQADYTKKTQALASQRQELTAETEQVRQERQQYAAALPRLEELISGAVGPEPTPEQYTDRQEYLWAKDQWNANRGQLEAVKAERQRIAQQQQEDEQRRIAAWAEAEAQNLQSKLPEWGNSEVRDKEQRAIREYGLQMGFAEQELGNVRDHRFVLVLRDAMRFRELQTTGRKKAKQANKTKTVAPGSGDSGVRGHNLRKQMERAKASGKVEDIAPLMGRLLAG